MYRLRGENYEKIDRSTFVPKLDLNLLANYVLQLEPLDAVIEFRQIIRQQLHSSDVADS
jgi:hypothetical protein